MSNGGSTTFTVPPWLRDMARRMGGSAGASMVAGTNAGESVTVPTALATDMPGAGVALGEPDVTTTTPPPDGPNVQGPTEIADQPYSPGNPASNDRTLGGVNAFTARQAGFPRMPTGTGPGAEVMPEGENYFPVGGQEGRKVFEDTFVNKPREIGQAIDAGAEASANESDALAGHYKNLIANQSEINDRIKEQYDLKAQETAAKQAEIEKQTQTYTNNLADQGAFWHNPQNVVSAIAAAFMNLATDDRTLPVKMLHGAIQQDLAARRQLMEGHLGNLRSNLYGYDKMMGDKISGMQVAQAEALRVAAMEVSRIGAQFAGPKYKAKAAIVEKEFLMKSQELWMNAYRSSIYNAPHMERPQIIDAYAQGGKRVPGVGWTPFAGFREPKASGPGGGLSTAVGVAKAALTPVGAGSSGQASFQTIDPATKAAWDKRIPGISGRIEAARNYNIQRIWSVSNGNPHTFNEKMEGYQRLVEEDIKEIAKQAGPSASKRAGYQRLGEDMGSIESELGRMGIPPQEWLGSPDTILGSSFMSRVREYYNVLGSNEGDRNKYQRNIANIDAARQRFRQLLSGNVNAYFKDVAGSAVTGNELPRLREYIHAGAPWDKARTFVSAESSNAEREYSTALATARDPMASALFELQVGLELPGGDTRGNPGPASPEGKHEQDFSRPEEAKPPVGKEQVQAIARKRAGMLDLDMMRKAVQTLKK